MNPLPGFVYFDPEFVFKDGETGRKLFVVLINSLSDSDNVLVARTTSKTKSDNTYGCHLPSRWETVFFIPSSESQFKKDTWVRFDYLTEYENFILKRWKRVCELTIQQTRDMLACGSQSYTLSSREKDALANYAKILRQ